MDGIQNMAASLVKSATAKEPCIVAKPEALAKISRPQLIDGDSKANSCDWSNINLVVIPEIDACQFLLNRIRTNLKLAILLLPGFQI